MAEDLLHLWLTPLLLHFMICHGKLITFQKWQYTIKLSHHFFHWKPFNPLFQTESWSVSPGDIVQKEAAIFKSLILDPMWCISDKLDYISQISSQHALDQSSLIWCLLMSWTITRNVQNNSKNVLTSKYLFWVFQSWIKTHVFCVKIICRAYCFPRVKIKLECLGLPRMTVMIGLLFPNVFLLSQNSS